MNAIKFHNKHQLLFLSAILTLFISCKKAIDIGASKTEVGALEIFVSDNSAKAGMAGIYADMRNTWAGGSYYSVSALVSYSADEMDGYNEYYFNNLLPSTPDNIWGPVYKDIYAVNAMLEGLAGPNGLSMAKNNELTGENKFLRAFYYFYLVNFYGDVPLVTGTDWQKNNNIGRTPKAEVYKQIIQDLKDAESLLQVDYSESGNERICPNKWAATALLARVYLYLQDWSNAEIQATAVIDNNSLYDLVALDQVFLKNSKEAIWQIGSTSSVTGDVSTFSPYPFPGFNLPLKGSTFDKFKTSDDSPGQFKDQRVNYWVTSVDDGSGNLQYFPAKYKDDSSRDGVSEYSMVMRISEQYLIRAEARAQKEMITGTNSAESDLNAIRGRAGLSGTPATSKNAMLRAIEDERLREFFTEWGHRWLDLKRTGRAANILTPIKPNWNNTKELFPIPQTQITNDPAMKKQQNPGYQ